MERRKGTVDIIVMYNGQSEFELPPDVEYSENSKLYVNGNLYNQGAFFKIIESKAVWTNLIHTLEPSDVVKFIS